MNVHPVLRDDAEASQLQLPRSEPDGQPDESSHLEPADPGRYSGLADVPPSAAHTTPWSRPRQSRGLWPEARWSEGAAPPSRPCRTGTAAPELTHSDDPPHAPWFASATHGPSVYPQPQPSGIPADPFSRSPYEIPPRPRGRQPEPGLRRTKRPRLGRLLHPPGSASASTNPEDRAEPGREPEADGMRGGKS